jgi:hypothetical protein
MLVGDSRAPANSYADHSTAAANVKPAEITVANDRRAGRIAPAAQPAAGTTSMAAVSSCSVTTTSPAYVKKPRKIEDPGVLQRDSNSGAYSVFDPSSLDEASFEASESGSTGFSSSVMTGL